MSKLSRVSAVRVTEVGGGVAGKRRNYKVDPTGLWMPG